MGELGGTGATFIVPIIFILFMKSKQLKAVGKASIVPVMFAVNEPLLFAAPIVLNPYFLIPFCLAPIVNVILGKFFISVLGMNGYMHVLPWATPGPIGNLMSTHFQPISFVFTVLLLVVDFIIYYPFCKAYDKVLLSEETKNANTVDKSETNNSTKVDESETVKLEKEIKILVLCAGAGTSAMLANALTEGASSLNLPLSSSAGAYGSHYEIMKYYDMVILAPQVKTYYNDIKKDTEKLGIKLIATEGAEYINLTRNPEKAVQFVLEKLN